MSTESTTTNNAFRVPTAANNGTDFATGVSDLATDVDGMWLHGTLVSLPAASKAGRRYYATDIAQELYDTGSSWISVGSATPIGALMQYGGAADPVDPDGATRWLICDGRAINRSTFSRLFTALSTTYGSGNGSTTFNIPDLRGRVPVGADSGGVHLPTNHPALGASDGEENHTLSGTEMPAHSHVVTDPGHVHQLQTGTDGPLAAGVNGGIHQNSGTPLGSAPNTQNATTGISLQSSGSSAAHNNLQPYLAVNHIIKVL